MTNLKEFILNNFNANVSYIEYNHPSVFEKLSSLDNAIAHGHYAEKYELVYENENFDVLEKSTNTYLYSKKSSEHAIKSAESIDYSLQHNAFEGFNKYIFTQNELNNFKNDKTFQSHLPSIAQIINYTNKNSTPNKTLCTIDKFIFFGLCLGLHIDSIHKKIKAKSYLIIEDDLELFRLSLFTINYQLLAQTSQIFFSVFEEQIEYEQSFNKFLEEQYQYNHYIKYFHLLSHKDEKIEAFHTTLTSQAHLRFLFNDLFKQYMHPLEYILDDYKFLNKNINFENSSFSNIPFLLITMGPSLQKNINWLIKNHKKFIIIAVSSSLVYLEKENITPNIIIHIDPFELGDILFSKLKSTSFIKDSISIFSTSTPKNISSFIDKRLLYLFETGTSYKTDTLKLATPCVGSAAYQLLLIINANPIYLLGLDMAVDNETNATHTSNHEFNTIVQDKKDATDYKNSLIQVDGNFTSIVKTTPHFNTSLQIIEYFAPKLKSEHQHIYNLSSGAKISCADAKVATDLDDKDMSFMDIQKKLEKFFNLHSNYKLSSDELISFNSKLKHAIELKNKIINNIDLFNVQKSLDLKISYKSTELDKILDSYLRYILVYIENFFNDNNLENKQKHIDNIRDILAKELIDIIQHYINILENKLN